MAVTNGYCTVAELRSQFGDATSQQLDTTQLEKAINSASRQIDRICNRRFWLDASVQVRTYRPDASWWSFIDDVGTTTGLIVKTDDGGDGAFETTWTAGAHYQLEPLNADAQAGASGAYAWWKLVALDSSRPFPISSIGQASLQVTARFGWSAVPDEVNEACILKAAKLVARKDSPLGMQGFGEFGVVRVSRYEDPDVQMLLGPFIRSRYRSLDYDPSSGTLFHSGRR